MNSKYTPDADFEISGGQSGYYYLNVIYIGMPPNYKLTDDELVEFVSDSITHEYIHHILSNMFSITVSCLFDAIGDGFRNTKLSRKVIKSIKYDVEVWTDVIKRDGIDMLIRDYNLDIEKVKRILRDGC